MSFGGLDVAKQKKPILLDRSPTIKIENGLFIVRGEGVRYAYPPHVFIAATAAANAAIREWQDATANDAVVPFRKRDGAH